MYLIPLARGGKGPAFKGVNPFSLATDDEAVHRGWAKDGLNRGYPAGENGSVIVDFDDLEIARDFYKKHRDIFGPMVRTRKGIHAYFSGDTRPKHLILDQKKVGDIRAGPTYCVFPDSRVWHPKERVMQAYEWVKGHEWDKPPPFPAELFPDHRKEVQPRDLGEVPAYQRIVRARAYGALVTCVPNGTASNTLFRFCCWMRDLGLSPNEALSVLAEWNQTNCFEEDGRTPYPWSWKQLEHKVQDAYAKGKR